MGRAQAGRGGGSAQARAQAGRGGGSAQAGHGRLPALSVEASPQEGLLFLPDCFLMLLEILPANISCGTSGGSLVSSFRRRGGSCVDADAAALSLSHRHRRACRSLGCGRLMRFRLEICRRAALRKQLGA